MRLTLGPLQYFWPRQRVLDFYAAMAALPLDVFYLGETVCKGRYQVRGEIFHALEEPTSLNTLDLLPQLAACGIAALKIEGRQRSPAYVGAVAAVWRQAIDRVQSDPAGYRVEPSWQAGLARVAEGTQTTLGPYHRSWH